MPSCSSPWLRFRGACPHSTQLLWRLVKHSMKRNIKSLAIWGVKVEQIEKKLDEQRRMLDDLIVYSMSFYIYDKLKNLHLGPQLTYVDDESFNHDLRYLRDHGYLHFFQISELVPGENLVGKLKVTPMGQRFVALKEARSAEDHYAYLQHQNASADAHRAS
jgi:hypothetical protein